MSCLVDLLISEKKWVEESSYLFPFKLSLLGRNDYLSSKRGMNGLSSMFTGKSSNSNVQRLREFKQDSGPEASISGSSWPKEPQSFSELKSWSSKYFAADALSAEDLKKQFETDFRKKLDPSIYGFLNVENLLEAWSPTTSSSTKISKFTSNRTRGQILHDCKKLLIELFRQYPDGFNMGTVKPLFYERYGYCLDNQLLGYQKLASLLQLIPGVRVESAFVLPADKLPKGDLNIKKSVSPLETGNGEDKRSHSDDPLSESSGSEMDQDNDLEQDSDWAELGPISQRKSVQESAESLSLTNAEIEEHVGLTEVEVLADKGVSDSDDERSSTDSGERKCVTEVDSSLVQILESWYNQKDEKADSDTNQLRSLDGFIDCSGSNNLQSHELTKSKSSLGGTSHLRRTTTSKKYSFVSD